jgi:hypothetical protein
MSLTRRHKLLATAVFLGLIACNSDDARLAVSVSSMPPSLTTSEVRYRIVAGAKAWTATLPATSSGTPGREFDTPTSGTARVAFTMVLPGGREVSAGEVTVALRGDWTWGFDLSAATQDPARTCFGCSGSKAFALPADLRSAGRDSLWLVWGGNSIKHPVVY